MTIGIQERDLLQRAIAYAVAKHEGDRPRRVSGLPYITHPLTVMLTLVAPAGSDTRVEVLAAAVLHDVVENTDATLEEVARKFGSEVARIVGAVSRQPGEVWMDYIERLCEEGGFAAIAVKTADIQHNLSQSATRSAQARYADATEYMGGWLARRR